MPKAPRRSTVSTGWCVKGRNVAEGAQDGPQALCRWLRPASVWEGCPRKGGVVRWRLPTTRHDWPGAKSYKGHTERSLPRDCSTDSSSLPPSSQIQQIAETQEGRAGPGGKSGAHSKSGE